MTRLSWRLYLRLYAQSSGVEKQRKKKWRIWGAGYECKTVREIWQRRRGKPPREGEKVINYARDGCSNTGSACKQEKRVGDECTDDNKISAIGTIHLEMHETILNPIGFSLTDTVNSIETAERDVIKRSEAAARNRFRLLLRALPFKLL